jgi:hypothetical protein
MSSSHIAEEKLDQIKKLLRGRVNELCLIAREGCLVLRGSASSYHGKQLAQHHVMALLEVSNLVNEIEVLCPPDQ